MISYLLRFLNKGHERTVKAKKNVLASLIFQGINKALGFLLVPMALSYLDTTRYGIWLTVNSITGYLIFFDIGLGSGLRTKFAQAVAEGDKEKARKYVSTTYAILSLIVICFIGVLFCVNPLLDWTGILNTDRGFARELQMLAVIVFGFFSFRMVFQLISTLLLSDQRPAVRELILLITQVLIVAGIFLLMQITSGSLVLLGLVYSAVPVFVLAAASIFFFSRDYKEYIPSIKYIDLRYYKDLLNLGFKFFIIKMYVVILLTTDNLIITQLYEPAYVTPYQIAHRYFFVIVIFFAVLVTPFWSAVTEAYSKNEVQWIRNAVRKLLKVWVLLLFATAVMLALSGWVYTIWIGDRADVPFILSVGMAAFVLLRTLNSPFSSFLNGVGKIKIQMYVSIVVGIINIPLSIVLAKYTGLGLSGVIFATALCLTIPLVFHSIQYNKIINNTARGIWNR